MTRIFRLSARILSMTSSRSLILPLRTGTYYVRIAVNIGDPILYTDAYYAWAILELTE